jgi:hypothetical protein
MKKVTMTNNDGTTKIHTTPRIEGTYLYFTGRGDDLDNGIIGDGPELILSNKTNPSTAKSISFGFTEDIWLKDGYVFWTGAELGDYATMEIYLPAGVYYKTPRSTGNFDSDGQGGYVPNATWTGEYLCLPTDYTLNRFVNKIPLIGDNPVGLLLESSDVDIISTELRMRVIMGSPNQNPNLEMACTIEMYRTRTV